jgi:hypothetical protein
LATAYAALAEVILGQRDLAFVRARTLARAEKESRALDATTRNLGRLVVSLLTQGAPTAKVKIELDRQATEITLDNGFGRLPAPNLALPGTHQIRVTAADANAVLFVRAQSEFGLGWDEALPAPGPLVVSFEGAAGDCDTRASLVLVAQNRSPRTLGRPVLEISLPAGAELDEPARQAIRAQAALEPDATRGTLRLELWPLAPGAVRRVPLPLRWSVAGRLTGLGVTGYPADQPEAVSVTPPRSLEMGAPKAKP